QQHKTQRIPEPAIAHPRGGQHPVADPARSAPAVHPPHHAMVAAFDESPDLPCDGHGLLRLPAKSSAPAGSVGSTTLHALSARAQIPPHARRPPPLTAP